MVVFRHLPYGRKPAIRILSQQSQGQGHPLQGVTERERGTSAHRHGLCPLLPLARFPSPLPQENQRFREATEVVGRGKAEVLGNNAGVLENNAGVLIKRRKESEPTWIRSLLLFIYIPLFMRMDSRWDRSHPSGSCSRSRQRGCPCTSEPPTDTYPDDRT